MYPKKKKNSQNYKIKNNKNINHIQFRAQNLLLNFLKSSIVQVKALNPEFY